MLKTIKQQVYDVIQYSQNIPDPQVDDLIDKWLEAKRDFIEVFGGTIWEDPYPVTFSITKEIKDARTEEFIRYILDEYGYTSLAEFVKRNKDKGIIWFFESCDLNVLEQLRVIWKLKNAGWFEGVKAVLIGRPLNTTPLFDYDYKQANYEHLKDLNVPVVIDLDIGHTSPNWTIVNGANTHFTFDGKKAKKEKKPSRLSLFANEEKMAPPPKYDISKKESSFIRR